MSEPETQEIGEVLIPAKGFWFTADVERKAAGDPRYAFNRVSITVGGSADDYNKIKELIKSALSHALIQSGEAIKVMEQKPA